MAARGIRTERAPAPVDGAPYQQAVAAVPGEVVWISGQVPLDPATGALAAADVAGQTRTCLAHVRAIVEAAGGSMDDVVKTTVFMLDLADFAEMNAVYAEAFSGAPPARATIGVAALPAAAKVEIEAVAVIGAPAPPLTR
ncbi:MAG: Rid family detoxifying hydrolase [Miltoncostaeaceae bacterium]